MEVKKLTRRRPVNLYPPFLFWPGCGSFAYGWGQDHPNGIKDFGGLGGWIRKLVCRVSYIIIYIYMYVRRGGLRRRKGDVSE